MRKLSEYIVRYRWIILTLVMLLSVFFGYQLKNIQVDSNVINSLPANDTIVQLFKHVGKTFGGNQMGMIILESDNVFEPNTLENIIQITDTLQHTDGISSVTSLTNVMNFNITEDNFQIGSLINDSNWPKNHQEAVQLRNSITSNKMYRASLVSADGKATIIVFFFKNGVNDQTISRVVKTKIDALHLPDKIFYGGSSFMTTYVSDVISTDLIKLIPIAFLVMALVLFLSFRSFRGVTLPLLTAGLAIVWAMGIFVLMGLKLSMVSNNVPIIILAVGTAYTIHILNRVNMCKDSDLKHAIIKSLTLMIVPVSLTALTTMIGFLSFIFGAYLGLIRDFGFLAALGTFFSALLAIFFVPALLAVLPDNRTKKIGNHRLGDKSFMGEYILKPLKNIIFRHPGRIIIFWSLLMIISIIGIFHIKRNTSVSDYFKKNHPATLAENIMRDKFGGSKVVFVVFDGDMQSPSVLKKMLATEKYMKQSPFITSTNSIADIIAKMNKAIKGKEVIPDASSVGQLWFLLGQSGSINQLVNEDMNEGIVIAKFDDQKENAVITFNNYLQAYLNKERSADCKIHVTGMPYVNEKLDTNLVKSQFASLALAIVMVLILVSLMMKSLQKGIYVSLPIITTIIILYGIMGLLGIPLNIVTALVASIALGIGIDYSIHFMSHYEHSFSKLNNIHNAIEETMMMSGKAILINFISVSAGFLVLVFSDLVPMIYFGILIAASMLGSSLGALTLLPVILIKRKIIVK